MFWCRQDLLPTVPTQWQGCRLVYRRSLDLRFGVGLSEVPPVVRVAGLTSETPLEQQWNECDTHMGHACLLAFMPMILREGLGVDISAARGHLGHQVKFRAVGMIVIPMMDHGCRSAFKPLILREGLGVEVFRC